MTALLLALTLSQTPTFLGPYTRLGNQDEASFLDGGSLFTGSLVYGTDAGLPYVYTGSYWQGIPTATSSAMTLYVDADGGTDLGPCTSAGAGACKTVQAAVNKVPTNVRHSVAINIATGTYNENVSIENRSFTATGLLTLQGTDWVDVTPTTGTASGTVTGYTAPSNTADLGTLTDSTQTWTVDEFKGYYVVINGVYRVIAGNTATSLSLTAAFTSPIGSAYRIQIPAATINGTMAVNNLTGLGGTNNTPFTLSMLNITASSGIPLSISSSTGRTLLSRCRISRSSGIALSITAAPVSVSAQTNYVTSGGSPSVISLNDGATLRDTAGFTRLTGGGAGSVLQVLSGTVTSGGHSPSFGSTAAVATYETTNTSTSVAIGPTGGLNLGSVTAGVYFVNAVVRGAGATAGTLISVASGLSQSVVTLAASRLRLENATTGISLGYSTAAKFGSLSTVFFSSVTNEFSLGGTTYSSAFISTLSPNTVTGPYNTVLSFNVP